MIRPPPRSTLFPSTTLFRSSGLLALTFTPALCATLLKPIAKGHHAERKGFFGWFNRRFAALTERFDLLNQRLVRRAGDRKSTRLNSSHLVISYAVFCLKKKN